MAATIRRKKTAKARIDWGIQNALRLAGRPLGTKRAFERLLHVVRGRTDLLRPTGAGGRYEGLD